MYLVAPLIVAVTHEQELYIYRVYIVYHTIQNQKQLKPSINQQQKFTSQTST